MRCVPFRTGRDSRNRLFQTACCVVFIRPGQGEWGRHEWHCRSRNLSRRLLLLGLATPTIRRRATREHWRPRGLWAIRSTDCSTNGSRRTGWCRLNSRSQRAGRPCVLWPSGWSFSTVSFEPALSVFALWPIPLFYQSLEPICVPIRISSEFFFPKRARKVRLSVQVNSWLAKSQLY